MGKYKIYKHVSPSNKIYIGITRQEVQKRWTNGSGYKECPAFYEAIKKYGWDNFKHIVIYDKLTKEEAEAMEIKLIALYESNNKRFGYNIENGGNCCGTHSEETKRKISASNTGKKYSAESIEKMRQAHKGKQTGPDNPFYGRKHKDETKRAHSEFMKGNSYFKGHRHSEEYKRMKSEQMSAKYKDGGSPRCRPVIQKNESGEIIKRYYSLREVSRIFGVSPSTVYNWIKNSEIKEWCYE